MQDAEKELPESKTQTQHQLSLGLCLIRVFQNSLKMLLKMWPRELLRSDAQQQQLQSDEQQKL